MIYTSSQFGEILVNAPTITPDTIFSNMGGASYYGENALATYQNMWYTYENSPQLYRELYLDPYVQAWDAGGSAVTPSAVEMLNTEPVVNSTTGVVEGTKAGRVPPTTTGAGNVKEGALAGRVTVGTALAGIAIGAGVGLYEVASHPKFWNDLSDAIVHDLKNGGNIQSRVNGDNTTETLQVLWRVMQDGSIQSYCDKRSADAIIRQLYAFDCFNVIDRIDVDINHAGWQHVTSGALDSGYALRACELTSHIVSSVTRAYTMTQQHYPTANIIECDFTFNENNNLSYISFFCWNVPDGDYLVRDSGSGYYLIEVTDANKVGSANFNFDEAGTVTSYDFLDGQVGIYINVGERLVTGSGSKTGITCNIGATFKPKNPNVIYNGTDVLPPSDPSMFWSTFSQWLNNGFTNRTYDPLTNQFVDTIYIPFTTPDINWQTDPITGNQTQTWTGIYPFTQPFTDPSTTPQNNPSPWAFQSVGNFTIPDINIPTPSPWDNNPRLGTPTITPIGSSPTLVAPSSGISSGSKLYSVYNPSQANIDSLGAYLWNSSIIDQICKFFSNNPLDAIISLHMIYCTPTTGTSKNIVLGYLDSGVSSPVVTSQYETIACGDVNIPELYGNALDYDGVSVQAFLPFIGWRTLRTKEVMGKRVRITYKIDVYTGTCLALISVISANTDQLLYSFEGNCSVQIPLTASDRTRLISGLITAGVSAYTGNPAGVVGGIASIKQDVDRAGSFSGNAGAMGIKKPYIVIARSLSAQASGYNSLYGYPLNKSGVLKNFKGFTRVQSVHVDIPKATDYEKKLISELLRNGIII